LVRRIEVGFKSGMVDALGESTKRRMREDLKLEADSVRTIDCFTIDADFDDEVMEKLGRELFADPVIQEFEFRKPLASGFEWVIEVGFKPGVKDNVGDTAKEAVEDILRKELPGKVYSSRQYLINGKLAREQVEAAAQKLLANDLIERWQIADAKSWNPQHGFMAYIPRVKLDREPRVSEIPLKVRNSTLVKISRERLLALELREMKAIQKYYRRPEVAAERAKLGLPPNPTDVELECLAQTWSEHCKHKIFNARIRYVDENGKMKRINSLFKSYVRKSTEKIAKKAGWLVSVFTDNAGVIRFNDNWNAVMKVETHNTPSALDPYGGALTGIVGVNRDPMGTGRGSWPIFNTDVFCFASPFYSGEIPPRLHHPKRIFEGVRKGVEHGGNKIGIPVINGCIVFDDRYLGKPLVYCGTGGLMPAKIDGEDCAVKKIDAGDLVLMVGGRIGRDGIHGATFSSEELHEGSPVSAVQLGDPITQKKMQDFLMEARDLLLYKSITDNGAGGLSSSIGELAQVSGGCEICLDKAPLKYPGLDPWEILISESQERMTVGLDQSKLAEFVELAKRRGVEATVVGKFTDSGKFVVKYGEKVAACLEMAFLHEGVPQMKLEARWEQKKFDEPQFGEEKDQTQNLLAMLGRLNICSKEYVVRQYDHEVQGGSVVKPLMGAENDGPSDAAVVRPLLDSFEGLVVSNGICPRYGDLDAYWMAACAIDEALRNYVATGGSLEQVACLDNFCWPDPVKSEKAPDGEYKLAQLVRANMALYDFATAYKMPPISGKDSMKNDYSAGNVKISVPPTLLISAIGKINDARKAVTIDAKNAGDFVYAVGITKDELGASEFYAMRGFTGNSVPKVDAKAAYKLYARLSGAISKGLVASCHDCSDGGLGVALAETAFAGMLGMNIDLRSVPSERVARNDAMLFSESQSRFVVTVSPEKAERFEKAMKGAAFAKVGDVRNDEGFVITGLNGEAVVKTDVASLKSAWKKTLNW